MAVEKVYPLIEELSSLNNHVPCPEEGCTQLFTSESNLTLHLVKTHKKHELWLSKKIFYCPIPGCYYNENSSYKSIKPLRQHYLKVHMEKNYECTKCQKIFVSDKLLKGHSEYCGVSFKCMDCTVSYTSYETLQTHCRRKKHNIRTKKDYKIVKEANTNTQSIPLQFRLILPKSNVNLIIPTPESKIVLSQGSQTESLKPKLKTRSIQVENTRTDAGTQICKTTQTNSIEYQSNETQTLPGDSTLKHSLDEYNEPQKRKSIKVQTNSVESKTSSCNTSFDLNDFEFSISSEIEKFSSSTQTSSTNNYSSSTMTHDSIHTDTSDLLIYGLNDNLGNLDSSFFNCHMETQTDILDNDDIFNYCDYYSNHMYTQTCDDILGSSVFINSETQTRLNEMFNSVESQTIMSHVKLEDKDKAHIETQTDTEFNIKLEEIHS